MSLDEKKMLVRQLVREKGFGDTKEHIKHKLWCAFIELGEASDIYKKHGLDKEDEFLEELIDVVFYILDAASLANPDKSLDEIFMRKLEKNMGRQRRYGESALHEDAND